MILADFGLEEAKERLAKAKGHVREAIKSLGLVGRGHDPADQPTI